MAVHRWDLSVAEPNVKELTVDVDGSDRASRVWAVGGKSNDAALIVQAYDPTLINAGFPLLETVNTDKSSEASTAVLQSFATQQAVLGRSTQEVWGFTVRARTVPRLGDYRPGEYAQLVVGSDNNFLPAQTVVRRILNLTADQDLQWVKITTGEVYSSNGAAVTA